MTQYFQTTFRKKKSTVQYTSTFGGTGIKIFKNNKKNILHVAKAIRLENL